MKTLKSLKSYPGVAEAVKQLDKAFAQNFIDGCLPEACNPVNNASRRIIQEALKVCGHVYLCKINRPVPTRSQPIFRMIESVGEAETFCADFVLAEPNLELERLLLEREALAYAGTEKDGRRIDGIMKKAVEIGALSLLWT